MNERSNEPYRVVARRFRPKTFAELVGQDSVLRSLRNALAEATVPHAFLFSGSRGVGKTTTARILARALNCELGVGPEPCGTCAACVSILDGRNADVVEIDAASHNLVDDIRELRDRVSFASMGARYKVYILDEVHMLTRSAFNAFLKTLEEPPARVVFILATTELHKVPETIRSRCQVLLFRRVGEDDIAARLRSILDAEQLALPDEVLDEIAAGCRGGVRDAETALERILPELRRSGATFDLASYRSLVHRIGVDRSIEAARAVLHGEPAAVLHFADDVVTAGVDEREALGELLEILRAVLLLKIDGDDSTLVSFRGRMREGLAELAAATGIDRLEAAIQAGLVGRDRIRRFDDRRLVLELALLRMVEAGTLPTLGDLVGALEAGGGSSATAPAVPRARPAAGASDLRARVIAAIRREQPMLVATVEGCRFDGPDQAGTVQVVPQTDKRIHLDRLASPKVQELIRKAVDAAVGASAKTVFGAPAQPSAPVVERVVEPSAGDVPAPARKTPVARVVPPEVERLRDRFDGTLLD